MPARGGLVGPRGHRAPRSADRRGAALARRLGVAAAAASSSAASTAAELEDEPLEAALLRLADAAVAALERSVGTGSDAGPTRLNLRSRLELAVGLSRSRTARRRSTSSSSASTRSERARTRRASRSTSPALDTSIAFERRPLSTGGALAGAERLAERLAEQWVLEQALSELADAPLRPRARIPLGLVAHRSLPSLRALVQGPTVTDRSVSDKRLARTFPTGRERDTGRLFRDGSETDSGTADWDARLRVSVRRCIPLPGRIVFLVLLERSASSRQG